MQQIKNNLFIDIAFIRPLIRESNLLHVLEKQAMVFTSIGDMGENTVTYRKYRNEIRNEVINTFKNVYKDIENKLKDDLVEDKARHAWKALITLLASKYLIEKIGLGLGELLPREYADLTSMSLVIEKIIEIKTRSKRARGAEVIKNALTELGINKKKYCDIAPSLWWINLVMESEVFKSLFKFYYLMYSKNPEIRSFVKEIESSLLIFKDHEPDYDYVESEILKALLSRCAKLRVQYMNRLENALLFVKYLRRINTLQRWEWFIYNDILTYVASIYMVEIQRLSGIKKISLDVSSIIDSRKGLYAGAASILANLILLSPIFMQYAIEAQDAVVVTPADIVVAVLRLITKHHQLDDFTVSIQDVAKEIVEFWKESDILRRLQTYSRSKITPDTLYKSRSFNVSLALLINAGVEGIHISTMRSPVLKLPPRMIGYDSLFIRPQRLLPIVKKVWEV